MEGHVNQRVSLVCSISHSYAGFGPVVLEIKDTTVSLYRSETGCYVEIYHADYLAEGLRLAELMGANSSGFCISKTN